MQRQFLKRNRKVFLIIITALVILLFIVWIKFKPLKGQVEEFLPVSQEIVIRFFNLKPSLEILENQNSEFSELKIDGGWLKMKTRLGGLYILRIMPECKYESNDYFYVKTENKPDITRNTNKFISQTTRNGINYDMYLQYEDSTRLKDINKIYAISPLRYEVFGKRISKRSLLKSGTLNEREKFVLRNLPARAKIVDVTKLRSIEMADANESFWDTLPGRLIPWLILLILLALLLLKWKRIKTFYKRKFMTHKENLQEFGYISSGKSGGDPVQFRSYLNGIYNGDLSDANNAGFSDNQIGSIRSKVKELDKNIEDKKLKIKEFEGGENLPIFDPVRFVISMIIFIGVTIFSYFFYLSTVNKALFLSFADLNCETASKLNILPSQVELAQAINNSLFILAVPFTVFALGWILHMVVDNPKLMAKQRFLYLGTILTVAFFLDFLLATKIHSNINAIKVYCGYGADEAWYASTTFYIIIFMGFVVYIFWSLILNHILQQLEKINKKRVVQNRVEKLKLEIEDLSRRKDKQINLMENRVGNIAGGIDIFHQGWNAFMTRYPERFAEYIKKCEEIRNEFSEKITLHHG